METTKPLVRVKSGYFPRLRRDPDKRPGFLLQTTALNPHARSDRDIEIIKAVFENRFMTRELLLHLFPPDPNRTPAHLRTENPTKPGTNLDRRLARLFHHEYLLRFHTQIGAPFIYALDNAGARLLIDHGVPIKESINWREKTKNPAFKNIHHTLMLARLNTAFKVAERIHPTVQLQSFEFESKELQFTWTHRGIKASANPDAIVTLFDSGQPEGKQLRTIPVEADRGNEDLSDLADKFLNYDLLYESEMHKKLLGCPTFRVLTMLESPGRLKNILQPSPTDPRMKKFREKMAQIRHPELFYFTTEEEYKAHPSNVFADIYLWLKNPTAAPRPIVASPLPLRKPAKI